MLSKQKLIFHSSESEGKKKGRGEQPLASQLS
jgi:hypothetical protein